MNRLMTLVAASCLISGCVATKPLREIAVDTNRLVADTANSQTLLNILRAKDRMPMHFTSFTVLRGNLSVSGTAGLSLGLPEDGLSQALGATGALSSATRTRGVNTVAPSLSATVSANPSFDLAVYDTKQFQNGILAPVSESLIEYYLQNGWPEDLLTALFVARVDVASTDGSVAPFSITNSPTRPEFGTFIKATRMVSRAKPGSSTPLIPLSQFSESLALSDLDKLDGSKFDIAQTPQGVFVARVKGASKGIGFAGLADAIRADPAAGSLRSLGLACSDIEPDALSSTDQDYSRASCTAGVGAAPNITVDVYFRSPEAVLYFLGAYVRCDLQEEGPCTVYTTGAGTRIIRVAPGSTRNSLFTVRHRDITYSMPEPIYTNREPDHQGSTAMGLVQQLINLQKSADSLPVSSSIRLVP